MKTTYAVIILLSILVTAALLGPCMQSTLAQTGNVIYACIQKESGATRIVASANECRTSEKSVSWNVQGVPGPQGSVGPTGPAGPKGPARSFVAGRVAHFKDVSICTPGGLSCQEKELINVNLVEGGGQEFDLAPTHPEGGPTPLESIIHVQINKEIEVVECVDHDVPPTIPPTMKPCWGENDYRMNIKITKGETGTPIVHTVSPRRPIYSTAGDRVCVDNPQICPLNIEARLLTDSLLSITVDQFHEFKVIETESYGAITVAYFQYDAILRKDFMQVVIWNAGEYKADYVVSADDCTVITPLVTKTRTLNVQEIGTLKWELQARDPADQVDGQIIKPIKCTLRLFSVAGTLYDGFEVRR